MDTSKEYIEMCEKAQEIQIISKSYNQRQEFAEIIEIKTSLIKVGDSFTDNFANYWSVNSKFNLVWLPCQDQLQDLVFQYKDAHNVLIEFHQDCLKEYEKSKSVVLSFEKLWLIFIMKTIYNKYWGFHKKEWILIS